MQAHWPAVHVAPVGHAPPLVPQKRPAQFGPGSAPHCRVAHPDWQVTGVGTHCPATPQDCPLPHVPHDDAHPDGSAPHARPVQQFDTGAPQMPPEQT